MKRKDLDIEYISCVYCGKENIKGSIKCSSCKKRLDSLTKSCPVCAKRNKEDVEKCISCGYSFKKNHKQYMPILLSILFVLCLGGLVYLKKAHYFTEHLDLVIKLFGGLCVFSILYSTLSYGKKEIVSFNQETEKIQNDLRGIRSLSYSLLTVALVVFVILLIYLYSTIA